MNDNKEDTFLFLKISFLACKKINPFFSRFWQTCHYVHGMHPQMDPVCTFHLFAFFDISSDDYRSCGCDHFSIQLAHVLYLFEWFGPVSWKVKNFLAVAKTNFRDSKISFQNKIRKKLMGVKIRIFNPHFNLDLFTMPLTARTRWKLQFHLQVFWSATK